MPTRPNPEPEQFSPHASFEQLKKLAKELLKAFRNHSPVAARRFRRHLPHRVEPGLSDAQLVIAREYGFASWAVLKRYLSALSDWPPPATQVELVTKRFDRMLARGVADTVYELVSCQAEDLLDGHAARDPATAVEIRNFHPTCAGRSSAEIFAAGFAAGDARVVAARGHGFDSWNDVEAVGDRQLDAAFEFAVDTVVAGDLEGLEQMLQREPGLVARRSVLGHRAMLLHYVAANGVEIRRQSTPDNAVAIARALLDGGAEVDALAQTYGGGSAQTTLCLLVTSVHPAVAGVQAALAEVLLDAGAAVDGLDGDSGPLESALAFGYRATAEVLARHGARIGNVVTAAGLGRLENVRDCFDASGKLVAGAQHTDPFGRATADGDEILGRAFVMACAHRRRDVAAYLLERGAALEAPGPQGSTALHCAVLDGDPEMVEFLLCHGAPLELTNDYCATVLDAAVWAAVRSPERAAEFLGIIGQLLLAGADVGTVAPFPTGRADLDELLSPRS